MNKFYRFTDIFTATYVIISAVEGRKFEYDNGVSSAPYGGILK